MELSLPKCHWYLTPIILNLSINNMFSSGKAGDYAFNLHPDITTLGGAYLDLIEAYGWKSITILYQDNDSMMTLKQIFDRTSTVDPGDEFRLGRFHSFLAIKLINIPSMCSC